MPIHAFAIAVMLAACGGAGGKGDPAPPPPQGQSLAAAVAMVCAAPVRAEADPQFGDAAARTSVLAQHLSDGITNPSVKTAIDGWRSDQKTSDQRQAELAALIERAGLITPCRLAGVWASPDWGASEL